MFTLEQLTSFCAVYDHGSFSAAARNLQRDRSTIREHINSLEDNIDLELFTITGRKAIPTDTANSLYFKAKVTLRHATEFKNSALAVHQQELTCINIYLDILIPASLVLDIQMRAIKAFPHIQINWLNRSRKDSLQNIIEQKCQLAILPSIDQSYPEKQISYRNLGLVPLHIYARPDSSLSLLKQASIKDLQLSTQYISENHLQSGLDMVKISPIHHIISNNDILIELVKNHGWAILPAPFAAPYVAQKQLVEVNIEETVNTIKRSLALFFAADANENKVLNKFIEWISDYAKLHIN